MKTCICIVGLFPYGDQPVWASCRCGPPGRRGCLKAATVESRGGRVVLLHLHNDDDNVLTGSAARPAAISIARSFFRSEDSPGGGDRLCCDFLAVLFN
jgi:hypothetical protein